MFLVATGPVTLAWLCQRGLSITSIRCLSEHPLGCHSLLLQPLQKLWWVVRVHVPRQELACTGLNVFIHPSFGTGVSIDTVWMANVGCYQEERTVNISAMSLETNLVSW